jgi:hypothetical protein
MIARVNNIQDCTQPTIAGEACVSGSTFFLKDLFNIPREMRDFIADYIDTVNTFNFNVSTYRGAKDDLRIQNIDLWIESYIEIIPELQEFRNFVRIEMKRLDIPKFPDYVYDKKINHFFYTNTRKLEKLSTLLNKPFKSI